MLPLAVLPEITPPDTASRSKPLSELLAAVLFVMIPPVTPRLVKNPLTVLLLAVLPTMVPPVISEKRKPLTPFPLAALLAIRPLA